MRFFDFTIHVDNFEINGEYVKIEKNTLKINLIFPENN